MSKKDDMRVTFVISEFEDYASGASKFSAYIEFPNPMFRPITVSGKSVSQVMRVIALHILESNGCELKGIELRSEL